MGEYLALRFPRAALPAGLARLIHERTDGNPLFMVNLVDSGVAAGLLMEDEGDGRCGPSSVRWTE